MSELDNIDPELGFEINGPGRQYFDNVVIDNLMDAVVELSATVWTIRNRQIILENILKTKGIDAEALIEAHKPDDAELAAKASERASCGELALGCQPEARGLVGQQRVSPGRGGGCIGSRGG